MLKSSITVMLMAADSLGYSYSVPGRFYGSVSRMVELQDYLIELTTYSLCACFMYLILCSQLLQDLS